MKSSDESRPEGRIAWWALAFAIGIPLALILCRASVGLDFFYATLGMLVLLVVWVVSALIAAFHLVGPLQARAWWRASSLAVLPAFVVAVAAAPLTFMQSCNRIGDTIHFEVMRGHYRSVIQSMPDTGRPKLVFFDWGGGLLTSFGVVYDQSDEVVLPPTRQSAAWRARADKTELTCEGYFVTPMGDHFYLAEFPC